MVEVAMGVGECYCWCGERMRLMCASSAERAGTCDVEGCGGLVKGEELVYICTAHNKYMHAGSVLHVCQGRRG